MKKNFIIFAVLMIAALIIPVAFLFSEKKSRAELMNNADVNALLIELQKDWDNVEEGKIGSDFGFDFVVLDSNEKAIAKTRSDLPDDIGRATSERYTIRDVIKNGEVIGKVMIKNDYGTISEDAYSSARKMYGIGIAVESVLIISFLVYIYVFIVHPFEKMKKFATDVSSGNLDAPLEMDRGNVFGSFTESFDLMRSELNDARQKEFEAQRSKAELVARLSHDIKTPVASIRAMGEVLEAKSKETDQKEKLHSIVSKADQIDVLVSDLFSTTLMDLDNLQVDCSEQNSSVIKDIIKDADHKEAVRSADIESCLIICDPVRTTQVINNIINNSYKYAGTEIFVTSFCEEDCLTVAITDRGGGVSEDDLPVITKKFRRGKNSKDKQGAGLGLAIASELMEKMGGSLECSNADGGFRVKLMFRLA